MSVTTTLAACSQTVASNGPDGTVDSPSTLDDAIRYALSFTAQLRDGKGFSAVASLASGATTDIGAQNSFGVEITGTTTITSFGTNYNGPRFLRFTGALTLTHNATTLNLPGAANITTAAGDTCIAYPNSTANGWNVVGYQRADSLASITSGTLTASTSGTSIDFTGIPKWAKRVTLNLVGVSTSGTANPLLQIGSGSIDATSYASTGVGLQNGAVVSTSAYTTGFGLPFGNAANTLSGSIVLTLADAATNTWTASGNVAQTASATFGMTAGSKALAGALDRIRLTTLGGTDTFDAGSVNILYE